MGFLNSATGVDLGFYAALLVFVDEAAEDGLAPDPLPREVGSGVVGSRRVHLAAAMGSAPVVAGLVLGLDRPRVPLAGGLSIGPVTSVRAVSTNRSATASARGLRGGIFTAWVPGVARTAPDESVNCPARPRTRKRESAARSPEVREEVADLPGGPRAVRMGGDPGGTNGAGAGFGDEQAVPALQRQRAAGREEIGGGHGRRLGVRELPPGRVGVTFRRGRNTNAWRTRRIVDALTR